MLTVIDVEQGHNSNVNAILFWLVVAGDSYIHVFLTNISATVVVDMANSLKTHVVRLGNQPEMSAKL